ncbi:hypothetical protein ACEV7Z_23870, partial [Vibrio parahaemolyticus]
QHRHLGLDDARDDDVRAVPGEVADGVRLAGRGRGGAREAPDEVGREVLQPRERGARAVERLDLLGQPHQPVQGVGQ